MDTDNADMFCPREMSNHTIEDDSFFSHLWNNLTDNEIGRRRFNLFLISFFIHFVLMLIIKSLKSRLIVFFPRRQTIAVRNEITLSNATPKPKSTSPRRIVKEKSWSEPNKSIAKYNIEELEQTVANEDIIDQESHSAYCVGGYMPINIGQLLGLKQFQVIRKLGFGHFSTAWLCRDVKKKDYCAVKVVRSDMTFRSVALDELKLLKCSMTSDPNHEGHKRIIQLFGHFREISNFGSHVCMVFELMGPSLLTLIIQSDYEGIQQSGVRSITKQVLQGLVYLHEVCKIIHTDIKPENILIKVKEPYIRKLVNTASRFQELGIPMPRTYVSSMQWENEQCLQKQERKRMNPANQFEDTSSLRQRSLSEKDDSDASELDRFNNVLKTGGPMWIDPNIEVKIADLGNACWEDHHFSQEIQTKQYRALEVLLGAKYSFPADLWSIGCMAFELGTGDYLFNPKKSKIITSDEDHLGLIWEVLNGIPQYLTQSGTKSSLYFNSTGFLKNIPLQVMKMWKLEDVLVDKYDWKSVDAILFAKFLQSLIEPDPELRATASSALEHSWIREETS